jgi:hypothetical protein
VIPLVGNEQIAIGVELDPAIETLDLNHQLKDLSQCSHTGASRDNSFLKVQCDF